MNKYQKKVLEVSAIDAEVFELTKEKAMSVQDEVVDISFDMVFTAFSAIKSLFSNPAHNFLVITRDKGELVTVDKALQMEKTKVMQALANTKSQKYFIVENFKYKLVRKVK